MLPEIKSLRRAFVLAVLIVSLATAPTLAGTVELVSPNLSVEVDDQTGQWVLLDKLSNVKWPSEGKASPGRADWLTGRFVHAESQGAKSVRLTQDNGTAVVFSLIQDGRALEIRYETRSQNPVRLLDDALAVTDTQKGYAIVPAREGLLIPADSGKAFKRTFGTSDYEGCHMNMLALAKNGSALIVTWDDAYVFPELISTTPNGRPYHQKVTASFELRRSARLVRLMPQGRGDWNDIARAYRQYAQGRGLAVTLRDKIRRDPHLERMVGACDAKLWTCLARRMNEESTAEESVDVRWTFDEAAQIAEHLHNDLKLDRCFFMMGGWTEGGYDCRHPDDLPANPECGGNEALAQAVQRIQKLDYVACLHDNVQDMYRDAKSWDPDYIEKRPDGSLVAGGRWLGGRAYMVCAVKQLELAQRPQNLTAIAELFKPWSYFLDTTFAVPPRECFDPNHPIGRNEDIAWKIHLSDYARNVFGIFGSECGREWALPHSDFFEGNVGVSGRYYHNLKPEELGATVIPFFEMVYHDCQICYGKYGYDARKAAEFVAHHVLCARPLYYHSFPSHLYWKSQRGDRSNPTSDLAAYVRSDNGWAQGLHPLDVFIKNTYEILGPLHRVTAYDRLTELRYLTEDRSVRQATYGQGPTATRVIVNFSSTEAQVTSEIGGDVVLPPWGFLIEGPQFVAFHAKRWSGQDYGRGALFTLQPVDRNDLHTTKQVRVFHGFGPSLLSWQGKTYDVPRERTLRP